jgi:chromosome segregation ATPase
VTGALEGGFMAPPEQNGLSVVQTTVPIQHFKQQMAKAHRWYDVVRCLRVFYDHFRIAFPHLEELPKSYTDDWAEQFKESAREFVRTEDMHSVHKVLTGAGYGTDKWVHISAKEAVEIEQAFARLIEAVEHVDDYEITEEDLSASKIIPLTPNTATQDTGLEALQKRYDQSRAENRALQSEITTQQQRIAELEGQIRRQNQEAEDAESAKVYRVSQNDGDNKELETLQKRFEKAKKENHDLQEESNAQTKQIANLEGQIRRLKNAGVEPIETSPKIETTPTVTDSLELDKLQHRYNELQKDYRELQDTLAKKEEEVRSLNAEMKKLLANFEKTSEPTPDKTKKFETPSSMGAQVREYEQKLKANELLIQGLRAELERSQQAIEEYKDEMQRQRERRRIFEEEMEEERQNLREQMHKLKAVMATENRDNLSLEELEEMESEELLSYIEDVETEKQRAIAGLEALDAQEESYQKQLDAQQEELGTIQNDLDRYKASNLATEVEDAEKTIHAQREQLETLLSFSKNLKAQIAHLKERQDPMRNLVERLNMQEKALIRYIRINHDRAFMPHQAYTKQEE